MASGFDEPKDLNNILEKSLVYFNYEMVASGQKCKKQKVDNPYPQT